MSLADKIVVLDHGEKIAEGPARRDPVQPQGHRSLSRSRLCCGLKGTAQLRQLPGARRERALLGRSQALPDMSVRKNFFLGAYVHRFDRKRTEADLERVYAMFWSCARSVATRRLRLRRTAADGGDRSGARRPPRDPAPRRVVPRPRAARGEAGAHAHQGNQRERHDGPPGRTERLRALQIAHQAYVIENGRIVMEGDRGTLLGDERIRKAYIGA